MPSIGIVEKKRKKLTSDERLVFLLIASRMVVCPFSASAITSAPTRDSHIPTSPVLYTVCSIEPLCVLHSRFPTKKKCVIAYFWPQNSSQKFPFFFVSSNFLVPTLGCKKIKIKFCPWKHEEFFSVLAWLPKRPILDRNRNLIGSLRLLPTISLYQSDGNNWANPSSIYSWSIEPLSFLHSKLRFEWVTLESMICRSVTKLNFITYIYLFWETDYVQSFQIIDVTNFLNILLMIR